MPVSAQAISVVVRNSTIESSFPGGLAAYKSSCPNATFCTDGFVSRVGFMSQQDAQTFVNRLVDAGLAPSLAEAPSTIAFITQGTGFNYACDWLQLASIRGYPAVWLRGQEPECMNIPKAELKRAAFAIPAEEFRKSYELIRHEADGKVEVYRQRTTGQVVYVGRPFNPVRKWWQFWKRP